MLLQKEKQSIEEIGKKDKKIYVMGSSHRRGVV